MATQLWQPHLYWRSLRFPLQQSPLQLPIYHRSKPSHYTITSNITQIKSIALHTFNSLSLSITILSGRHTCSLKCNNLVETCYSFSNQSHGQTLSIHNLVKPLFSTDTNFLAYQSITTYHKITINYTGICHPPTSGLREHPKLMCHYIMLTLPLEFSLA